MQALISFEKKHASKKLFFLRVVVGALFIAHGIAKFGMWHVAPSAEMPVAMLWIMRILSIVEPIAGIAMILGFMVPVMGLIFTVIMLGAVPVKIFMFDAVFTGGWSYELLILAAAMVLTAHGGGAWSMDEIMKKKKSSPQPQQPANPDMNQGMQS